MEPSGISTKIGIDPMMGLPSRPFAYLGGRSFGILGRPGIG